MYKILRNNIPVYKYICMHRKYVKADEPWFEKEIQFYFYVLLSLFFN